MMRVWLPCITAPISGLGKDGLGSWKPQGSVATGLSPGLEGEGASIAFSSVLFLLELAV